jgi:CheY-like chemotaxis protein
MEEGKMTLNVVPISLEALIDGVHAMLLPSVRSGVEFTKSVHVGGRDWVLGDQHRIQQVLTNVVTNSIKYTISGTIDMKLSWEGGSIKFECVDTGPGIPKPQQDHLFHRFVQRGGAPGTGLGLAIAKQLVDLHNGSIRFESDPTVRSGTTCVVLLPLSLCDPPETKEDEVVFPIEQPLKVLITDDIKMNRVMLTRRLKKGIAPNCVIVEACTGEEALEICANDRFDVIIVDQYMEEAGGVMVGTDVVYAMRRMRIDSIIVGCSGNDLDREFTEAGANWVWKKPLPANAEIIAQLRLVLDDRSR